MPLIDRLRIQLARARERHDHVAEVMLEIRIKRELAA